MNFGTGFQPADIADITHLETSSLVTESIGFQPKPLLSVMIVNISKYRLPAKAVAMGGPSLTLPCYGENRFRSLQELKTF